MHITNMIHYQISHQKLYIFIFNNLRKITRFLPDKILNLLSIFLNFFLSIYIFLCKFLNLPLKDYMLNVIKKCSFEKRKYIIFDQLNPSYSKYYSKNERRLWKWFIELRTCTIHGYNVQVHELSNLLRCSPMQACRVPFQQIVLQT